MSQRKCLEAVYEEIEVAKQTEIEAILLLLIFLTFGFVFLFVVKPNTEKSKIHWLFKRFDSWFMHE